MPKSSPHIYPHPNALNGRHRRRRRRRRRRFRKTFLFPFCVMRGGSLVNGGKRSYSFAHLLFIFMCFLPNRPGKPTVGRAESEIIESWESRVDGIRHLCVRDALHPYILLLLTGGFISSYRDCRTEFCNFPRASRLRADYTFAHQCRPASIVQKNITTRNIQGQ